MAAPHQLRVVPSSIPASSSVSEFGRFTSARTQEVDAAELASRQLRRITLGTLQLLQHRATSQPGARSGQSLAAGLRQDTRLIAAISDVLLGQAARPEPLERSLPRLCEGVVALLSDAGQAITLYVRVGAPCPNALRDTVLRVAHELVSNAVRHGMHGQASGRIEVRLSAGSDGTALSVLDDGRGCAAGTGLDESLSLAASFAGLHGGDIRLRRRNGLTIASLELPHGTG